MIQKTLSARAGFCESLLCVIGITGVVVSFLNPISPYYADAIGVVTMTVIDLLATKWFIRRYRPALQSMLVRPVLKWWLLAHASLPYGILCAIEWLQSANIGPGVYDKYDYRAFTASYALTLALLAGSYLRFRRKGNVPSLLW